MKIVSSKYFNVPKEISNVVYSDFEAIECRSIEVLVVFYQKKFNPEIMRHFTPLALKKRSSERSFTLHSRVSKTIPDCSMHQFKNGCILTQSWRLNGSDFQGAQAAEEWICEILDHNNKWVDSMQLQEVCYTVASGRHTRKKSRCH